MPGPRGKVGVPKRARDVLAVIRRTGSAPAGYVGGAPFLNREGKLPATGAYIEYDVMPTAPGGVRGGERIVYDASANRAWYSPDHYRSFVEM